MHLQSAVYNNSFTHLFKEHLHVVLITARTIKRTAQLHLIFTVRFRHKPDAVVAKSGPPPRPPWPLRPSISPSTGTDHSAAPALRRRHRPRRPAKIPRLLCQHDPHHLGQPGQLASVRHRLPSSDGHCLCGHRSRRRRPGAALGDFPCRSCVFRRGWFQAGRRRWQKPWSCGRSLRFPRCLYRHHVLRGEPGAVFSRRRSWCRRVRGLG